MIRGVVCGVSSLQRCVLQHGRRNIGMTAVVAQQASAKLDPIQELFVNKIREYAKKSEAAGGKLVDATPDQEAKFKAEAERIDKMFNATSTDMTKFPTFNFSDPTLESVGLEAAESGMKEPAPEPVVDVEEPTPPEIPYVY